LNTNYTTRAYIDNSLNVNYYKRTQIDISYSNIITNSLVTIGSGTITAGGGFIGTSYRSSAPETDISFGNNLTTGCINIGTTQSSGDITLGDGKNRDATSSIYIGTKSTNGSINIGRGNTISINNSTPTLTINRPITVGYTTLPTASQIGNIVTAVSFTSVDIAFGSAPYSVFNAGCNITSGIWLITIEFNIQTSGSITGSKWGYCAINNTGTPLPSPTTSFAGAMTFSLKRFEDTTSWSNSTTYYDSTAFFVNNYSNSYTNIRGLFRWIAATAGSLKIGIEQSAVRIA
jgi:hypothetical protein